MLTSRKNSTEWKRTFALHVLALAVDIYGLVWCKLNLPQLNKWGGLSVYFTNWSHLIQIIYFIFAFSFDIKRYLNFHSNSLLICSKAQSLAFSTSFVSSSATGIIFWGIYFFNRDLILPSVLDAYYPMWLNILQHGATTFFIWLELLIQSHRNLTVRAETTCIFLVAASYLAWSGLAAYRDMWPYPFQRVMDLKQALIFYSALAMLIAILCKLKRLLVGYMWGYNQYKPASSVENVSKSTPMKRKAAKQF